MPGTVISAVGTLIMVVLFIFELQHYMTVTTSTTLVVDELVDEVLRVNFNVTLHEARQGTHTCPPHTGPPGSDAVAVPVPA